MQERELLEVDVLYVGGGIASLAGAYRLSRLAKEKGRTVTIAVLGKAKAAGQHAISGAVMDPLAMKELMPDYMEKGMPVEGIVEHDEMKFLTASGEIPVPVMLPFMKNHGFPIISLSKMTAWLARLLEKENIDVFSGYSAGELIYEGEKVAGIRCVDTGLDKEGKKKGNFMYGPEVRAKVTVLAEGGRGSLTKAHVEKLGLDAGRNKHGYTLGVKEFWEIEPSKYRKGTVIHTMGYPLSPDTFGGGFIYFDAEDRVSVGMVVNLDSPDPAIDPHEKLQQYKRHGLVSRILHKGKILGYGARVIPEGGCLALPELYSDGALIIGDAAGFVNSMRIKGIHLAMKSGMLAAETILEALEKNDFSRNTLKSYGEKVENSWIKKEMWKARNFHQAFHNGLLAGAAQMPAQILTGGWSFADKLPAGDDYKNTRKWEEYYGRKDKHAVKFDGHLTGSKEDCLSYSGTKHEENQPCHLKILKPEICGEQCRKEYRNPCTRFCPAKVYEMEEENGKFHLKMNPSNCLHCKACDIRDPYGIIQWTCPEGGGGPAYTEM